MRQECEDHGSEGRPEHERKGGPQRQLRNHEATSLGGPCGIRPRAVELQRRESEQQCCGAAGERQETVKLHVA